MKIQLTLSGGIYGHLNLQPIETEDKDIAFPRDLFNYIASPAFQTYERQADKNQANHPQNTEKAQTERVTYHLNILHPEGKISQYDFFESALEIDINLKKLVDFIWSVAQPIQDEQ